MNRSLVFRMMIVCLVLLMGIAAVHAQDSLLTNPGFEPPFVAVEGSPASTIAEGWTAWWSETAPNMAPEYYPASDTTNGMAEPRIHGGTDAQQYFTFFATHDAGVYQQVSGLTAGDELQFSVFAYVWSSSGDDANVSDGTGDLAVQVGIDPNGGNDVTSDTIVWSSPLALVDQYAQHTVTATAAGDTVTVFVRSTVNQVAMNNVVYLDDADLVVTGSSAIVTEEATEATTVDAPTAEVVVTEVVGVEPIATEAVVVEATEVEETAAVEASPEVTEATTVEPVVTEAVTVEAPTEVPPTATLVPTEPPTVAPPTEAPTEALPTEIPTDAPPTSTPMPSPTLDTVAFPYLFTYTVQRGDTVGQLATRFGSTIEAIIIANQLGGDARIFETQELSIPVKVLPPPTLPPTETPIPSSTPLPTLTPVAPVASETPIIVEPVTAQQDTVQVIAPQVTTYIVRYGDTLSSIAVRHQLTTRELARFNNIVNPNLVYVGQVLQIPVPGSITPVPPTAPPTSTTLPPTPIPQQQQLYQVVRGDNLYRISIRFNVPLALLIQVNGIANPTRIFVGQILIIPASP